MNQNNISPEMAKEYWQSIEYLPFLDITFTEMKPSLTQEKRSHYEHSGCKPKAIICIVTEFLTLKADVFNAYINIHPHRRKIAYLHFLLTIFTFY